MRYHVSVILVALLASFVSAVQDPNTKSTIPSQAAEKLAKSQPAAFTQTAKGQKVYYYMGDEGKLGEFLRQYAAIQQPQHRLYLDGKWNAITGRPVEPFRYDWMLSVPTAADRTPDANSAHPVMLVYPQVHISANSDRIAWEYLVIPEGLGIMPLEQGTATDQAKSTVRKISEAAAWSKGVAAWNEFAAKQLAVITREEGRPSPQWMEMRSAELTKWLPQYRVFALETSRIGRASTFAVDRKGSIVSLGSGQWSGKEKEPFRNPELADFLKGCHLKIATADEAVSMARFVEDLTSASHTIAFIKVNTRDFRVFDRRFYGMLDESQRDWKYTAAKEKGYWGVKKEYVGPPASVMEPLQPHLIVDANDVLMDIEGYNGMQ